MPREQLEAKLRELHGRVATHAGDMPPHEEVIARYCSELRAWPAGRPS